MCFKRDEQTKPFAAAGSTSNTSFFLSIAKHKKIKNRIKNTQVKVVTTEEFFKSQCILSLSKAINMFSKSFKAV